MGSEMCIRDSFNDTPVVPTGANAIIFEQANGTERTATEDTSFEFDLDDLLNGVTDPDLDLTANPINPYGDVLNVDPSSVTATNGNITYDTTTSKWTFTPNADFNGTSRIDYLIEDGQGGTIPNDITLQVDSVNDAPVATFTTEQNTSEGNTQISGQLTSTDVDLFDESTTETATYSFVSATIDDGASSTNVPAGLTINADGSWTCLLYTSPSPRDS